MAVRSANKNQIEKPTLSSIERLLLQVDAEERRRSLKQFLIGCWHLVEPASFVDGWIIDCLCEHFTAVTYGQIRKLAVAMPPRHTKSTFISVVWPVWDWTIYPDDKFLVASYSLDLSTRDNRRKR